MRALLPRFALLLLAAAAPAAAQGFAVPVRCQGECPPHGRLPGLLALDSVHVTATLRNGGATTHVRHTFRNEGAGSLDAAFFFPLPDGAVVTSVSVFQDGRLETYNQWSQPEESRWILEGILRERPRLGLGEYRRRRLVHVHVPSVPPGGRQHLQLSYTQPLLARGAALAYRYPLAAGAAAAPLGTLRLVAEVRTERGFVELGSPSHPVAVEWGAESGPCPPQARCGSMSVPSRRVKVVRLEGGAALRARDFELLHTPAGEGTPVPLPESPLPALP